MYAGVKVQGRILILDRSVLAGNLYRLLFSSLGAALVVRRKFEDFQALFSRRERVDLAILNSNAFGKKSDEILDAIESNAAMGKVRKIFILKEGETEDSIRHRVAGLERAEVVSRPFHPDEFLAQAHRVMGGDG